MTINCQQNRFLFTKEVKLIIELLKGDCLELMKEIPDNYVDLIITSPPYNLGKSHHTGDNRFKSYGEYDDDMPEELYQQWQVEILNECYRILKPNGSMWYNHKNRIRNGIQITPYEWILKSKFAHLVKQEIIWFNGSQNFDKCRFYPMTERVYWFAKIQRRKCLIQSIITICLIKKTGSQSERKGNLKERFLFKCPKI